MKLVVDDVVTPQAAGPGRAQCAIVQGQKTGTDVVPSGVAMMAMGEGRTVRFMLSPTEAQALGMMLIVCGCTAEGGPPPVAVVEPPKPLIVHSGGRA